MDFSPKDIRGKQLEPIEKYLSSIQREELAKYQRMFAGVLISGKEIEESLGIYAQVLAQNYRQQGIHTIVGVPVVQGGLTVFEKLVYFLLPAGINTIKDSFGVTRYGERIEGGKPRITQDVHLLGPGDHGLTVEDVIDKAITIAYGMKHLKTKDPASLRLFSLLTKPDVCEVELDDYDTLFLVDDHWLVGYGMDLSVPINGKMRPLYRDLNFVAVTNPDWLLETGQIGEGRAEELRAVIEKAKK
ncbi:MAG: phosphoribosyltransferase family protein [Candidatus Woesearchaeota archaeon]